MLRMVKKHFRQYSARVVSLAPRGEDKEAIVLRGYNYAWAGRETQWDLRKLHSEKYSGIRDSKMITELLMVKLADLSFDLAVQKYLAIEQASKDYQVLQGEQGPGVVNKLDTSKYGGPSFSQVTKKDAGFPRERAVSSLNLPLHRIKSLAKVPIY